jgi:hypothetical protein
VHQNIGFFFDARRKNPAHERAGLPVFGHGGCSGVVGERGEAVRARAAGAAETAVRLPSALRTASPFPTANGGVADAFLPCRDKEYQSNS